MKRVVIDCDCCGKKFLENSISVKLPLRVTVFRGKDGLRCQEMDICMECGYRISDFYYNTARENGHNGIHVIMTEDD